MTHPVGDAHIRFRAGTDIPSKLLNRTYADTRFFAMSITADVPRPCGHFHRDHDAAEQCLGEPCIVYKVATNGWITTSEP